MASRVCSRVHWVMPTRQSTVLETALHTVTKSNVTCRNEHHIQIAYSCTCTCSRFCNKNPFQFLWHMSGHHISQILFSIKSNNLNELHGLPFYIFIMSLLDVQKCSCSPVLPYTMPLRTAEMSHVKCSPTRKTRYTVHHQRGREATISG